MRTIRKRREFLPKALLSSGLAEPPAEDLFEAAACHWAWRELLELGGAIPDSRRVVRDGNVITGGGVTAGIDFALTVAAEVAGPELACALQLAIEYNPEPPFNAGSPERAPLAAQQAVRERVVARMPGMRAALQGALR
jgi:cyclohexyl-isocyanide hydratase